MRKLQGIAIALLVSNATGALAAESVTYSYDAKGRLVKVVRTGPANTQAEYQHDKTDNRVKVKTTGAL